MSDPQIAVGMLLILILAIFLGFPVAFTLMALGVAFGYYAYFDADRMWRTYERAVEQGADGWTLAETWVGGFFNNRIFDLFVNQTYSVMSNDVLTAIPLFLFMGYIVERANIVDRLFTTLFIATRRVPGSMAVAALVTCTLFATATGIVGAVVTLMGLLALPAMLKARYDIKYATGVICAGGTLGILIPPSILLIVYAATSGVSVVRMYAAALLPGLFLAGLYLVYVVGKALLQPQLAPKPTAEQVGEHSFLEISWMMFTSFVPLAFLILAVLGAILFGLATPSEAAAIGALGGLLLAVAYRALTWQRLKECVYLTARTSAMVCWLFVGSATFASIFAYLGGQQFISRIRHRPRHVAADVPDRGAAHHLHPRLAAGMDGDHRHLHPDLPAAAAAFRHRPAVLRHPGGDQLADRLPVAADGDVGLLPQGHRAGACADFRHLPRHDALHADRHPVHGADLHLPSDRLLAAQPHLRLTDEGTGESCMTRKRLFGLFAFLCLAAFFAVVLYRVPRLDLAGAVLIGLCLAAYDLWTQLKPRRPR